MNTIPAPESVKQAVKSFFISRGGISLFEDIHKENRGLLSRLQATQSQQGVNSGEKQPPFNMEAVTNFQSSNEHHATCINTKTMATVGLGFRDSKKVIPPTELEPIKVLDQESKVDMALNPLCSQSFSDVLNDVAEDYWQAGNGYMEVVRPDLTGPITGIHHVPAYSVTIFVEADLYNYHYIVRSADNGEERRFARFGDKERFLAVQDATWTKTGPDKTSEIIHIRKPSSLCRWYGFPDWLSCVPSIELTQCLLQYKYDFFLNRGVPEFLLFILGQQLGEKEWQTIESALQSNVGSGNSHKSSVVNIPSNNITIQMEKLAMESTGEQDFGSMIDTLALRIVTAHKVPPLLAGIQIPGKLGATNELPNALMSFQTLQIGPAQRNIQQRLGYTLGNPKINGGLALKPEDFYFRKITEEIDLGTMDTVGRMRQTVPEAKKDGRDLKAGVKD